MHRGRAELLLWLTHLGSYICIGVFVCGDYMEVCVCLHPKLLIYSPHPHFLFGHHEFVFNFSKSVL